MNEQLDEDEAVTEHSDRADGSSEVGYPISSEDMRRMLDEATAAIARETGVRAGLRALPTWARSVVAALGVLAMIGIVIALIPRGHDFQYYPAPRLWGTIAAYVLLIGVLVTSSLRPLHRDELDRRVVYALALAAFTAPYLLSLWPSATLQAVKPPNDCFPIGIAMGVALIMLVRALDRADASEPRVVLMVAAAAGITGNLTLLFHCADPHPLHLIFVHAPLGWMLFWVYRWSVKRFAPRTV